MPVRLRVARKVPVRWRLFPLASSRLALDVLALGELDAEAC